MKHIIPSSSATVLSTGKMLICTIHNDLMNSWYFPEAEEKRTCSRCNLSLWASHHWVWVKQNHFRSFFDVCSGTSSGERTFNEKFWVKSRHIFQPSPPAHYPRHIHSEKQTSQQKLDHLKIYVHQKWMEFLANHTFNLPFFFCQTM